MVGTQGLAERLIVQPWCPEVSAPGSQAGWLRGVGRARCPVASALSDLPFEGKTSFRGIQT